MDFEVIWTEPAAADLQAITTYIAQHNASAAERIATEILERVELLKAVPFMGRAYPGGSQGRNREIICGKYRIFYRVLEELKRVEILTVWHTSRDEPELPQV